MIDDLVHGAHLVHGLCVVGPAEEEDLTGEFLPGLPREVGAAEAAVEAADIGIGLLEPGVFAAGQGEVAGHVQAVPAAGRPSVDQADHHLGHEPDEPLHLQDVQPPGARRVDGLGGLALGVLVARAAPDALVATGAECPAAVLGRRAVAGQQDDTDVGGHPGVVEHAVELVDGVRTERVAHLGAVEGDPDGGLAHSVDDVPVVGDVGQFEAVDGLPAGRIERVRRGHRGDCIGCDDGHDWAAAWRGTNLATMRMGRTR